MNFDLQPLSKKAIPAALEKATRYRMLNEPGEAESICHDVLRIEPENQEALVTLLLALTDRFGKGYALGAVQAREVLPRLNSPYERAYYGGIIAERRAKALLQHGGAGADAFDLLREAMGCYEKAGAVRQPGNDDPVLRWNACARIIMRNHLGPRDKEQPGPESE